MAYGSGVSGTNLELVRLDVQTLAASVKVLKVILGGENI